MLSRADIESTLPNFTGTTRYFRHFTGVLMTEGAHFVAESCEAFWLMDHIASMQQEPQFASEEFQHWTLTSQAGRDGKGFQLRATDGNDHELAVQNVAFSDFPLDSIEFFVEGEGTRESPRVILLPSEH